MDPSDYIEAAILQALIHISRNSHFKLRAFMTVNHLQGAPQEKKVLVGLTS